jgi:tetrapyrrole methylase family protein / MazG family protein
VVAVGLGPAGPEHTTPAAAAALRNATVAFLRTARHPSAEPWAEMAHVVALDDCYEEADTFDDVYSAIVWRLKDAATAHGRVVYAVPGSPLVAERTVELLLREPGIDLEVVPGMSFCDLAWGRLGLDPLEYGVRLVDAEGFAERTAGECGPFLVGQCWSRALLSEVKLAYDPPPAVRAVLLHHLGLGDEVVAEVPWSEIDRTFEPDHLTSLYVPRTAVPVAHELVALVELVRVLRERCPWDRVQTHRSLVRHLLEESYEAIEAIESLGEDPAAAPPERVAHVEEELGDLLCQVLFHCRLASEEGLFDLADVARSVRGKLVSRHPHVFGDVEARTPDAVVSNWERIKQDEKRRSHLLEGVPRSMPALARAAKAERKLESVGLGLAATGPGRDWFGEALASVLDEGETASREQLAGDLVLALARLMAQRGEDPESLARHALDRLGERLGDRWRELSSRR